MATIVAKFFRRLSVEDLQKYFAFRNIDTTDIDWQAVDGLLRKTVIKSIDALPDSTKRTVFVDVEAIIELSDEAGHLAMLDAAGDRMALIDQFDKIDSAEGRALWLFMNGQETFKRAGLVLHCDQLREGRSWNGFIAPVGGKLDLSEDRLSAMASACSDTYRERDGFRGSVEVEHFGRLASWRDVDAVGSVTQITVYTEDRPLSLIQFEANGLQRQLHRPASEAHVTYCAADDAIDVAAKGGRSIRKKIASLFANLLLGIDCDPDDIAMREIDLSRLAERSTLAVEAGSPIGRVALKTVRFQPLDESSHYKLFGRRKHDIYDDFESGRLEIPGYEIDRVELIFEFFPETGQRRGKRITVTLTYPNGCSVKDKGQRYRPPIEAFLERAGIYRVAGFGDEEQFEAAE